MESTVERAAPSCVLLIEDDLRVREAVVRALTAAGHAVRAEANGAAGLQGVVDWQPDVVVLDLGLPDIDGADLLPMVRAVSQVPVLVATARDDEAEMIRLLDGGADDFIVKPFSPEQLDARIRAVLRRSRAPDDGGVLTVGELSIDIRRWEASLGGQRLDLSPKEFELLAHLAANEGRVVSKRELLADVWHLPYGGGDKTVDVHLSWLRRKLGERADAPRYLHTVRGVGVKLVAPDP